MKLLKQLGIDVKTVYYVLGIAAAVVTAVLTFHEIVHKHDPHTYVNRNEFAQIEHDIRELYTKIAKIEGKIGM